MIRPAGKPMSEWGLRPAARAAAHESKIRKFPLEPALALRRINVIGQSRQQQQRRHHHKNPDHAFQAAQRVRNCGVKSWSAISRDLCPPFLYEMLFCIRVTCRSKRRCFCRSTANCRACPRHGRKSSLSPPALPACHPSPDVPPQADQVSRSTSSSPWDQGPSGGVEQYYFRSQRHRPRQAYFVADCG